MNGTHVDPSELDATGVERERALGHLRTCAACRARIAAEDPSRLFALLRLRSVAPEALDAVTAGVRRRLTESRPSLVDGLREGLLTRAAAAAAIVALLLGAGTLVVDPARAPVLSTRVESARLAGVSVTATPGAARVVDLSVGDVQVVMIFDPEMKL